MTVQSATLEDPGTYPTLHLQIDGQPVTLEDDLKIPLLRAGIAPVPSLTGEVVHLHANTLAPGMPPASMVLTGATTDPIVVALCWRFVDYLREEGDVKPGPLEIPSRTDAILELHRRQQTEPDPYAPGPAPSD